MTGLMLHCGGALAVTLHANGQGDFILLRPLGTTRTVRMKATDLYRIALFHTSGQFAARVKQLRKEGHSLASARRQAQRALFATPPRRKRAPKPAQAQEPPTPATVPSAASAHLSTGRGSDEAS